MGYPQNVITFEGMLSIKPYTSPASICPVCKTQNPGFSEYVFWGMHILGKGNCRACGVFYYHNWPVGHGEAFPITFTDNGVSSYSEKAALWLAQPLIRAVKEQIKYPAGINRKIHRKISTGLLLNCLDPCFGHVIWKLFNVTRYQDTDPSQGLVVLIPAQCAWMVPSFVAEVWEVDIPLYHLHGEVLGLDDFVNGIELPALKILPVNTHPDHKDLDVQAFFKAKPFPLNTFGDFPLRVTFIWRQDRFWLRSKFEEWMWLVCNKYRWRFMDNWFIVRQIKAMEAVVRRVRRRLPKAEFRVAGLGTAGHFSSVQDVRQQTVDPVGELQWCRIYAQSHLVVGVHGSSMLIPSALAAGFLELIPRYKIPFLTEDILLKHAPRYQLFLGRHLDIFAAPSLVARHIVDIYSNFPYLQKNTEELP